MACINHYDTTTTYRQKWPQVRLAIDQPEAIFDPDSQEWLPDIGESSRKALRQFLGNKNKLSRNAGDQTQYTEIFQEMIETGHLEPVPEGDHNLPYEKHFVMPHHAVLKSSATTTQCRAVFNASAKTTNERSLNDFLLVGPRQQVDLFEIVIQFRLHRIALSVDIKKMYRQVKLNEKDRKFHPMFGEVVKSNQ